MKIKTHSLLTTALFTSLVLTTSFASAGLYRWVDDKGEVHFSDKVPVAASKKAHTRLNKNGASQKELDPEAKIALQKENERHALEKTEADRINKIVREKRAKVRKRDQYLLFTYENKAELVTSYETKIKMVKGNSAILLAHKKRLEKKVVALKENKPVKIKIKENIQEAASITESDSTFGLSQPVKVVKKVKKVKPLSLDKQVINIEKTIQQYKKALLDNDQELLTLKTNYADDLVRFSELTQ